ncbi:hypothetical protein J1N35_018640 [Gossypium stocksii]|uniref:Uncharacterized protein n=1 Tax=Gossypium stocksii TaxID=47602 RepID=A0A9D3VRL3_9ROSI|nr:hypothetical protein J1N35_018640 [Gossypium stocksii]
MEDPMLVPLFFTHYRVQVHDLHPGFYLETVTKQLGYFIRVFEEYDWQQLSRANQLFMRIRVLLDIRSLLRRRKKSRGRSTDSNEALVWECYELVSPRVTRMLQQMLKLYNPQVVFFMEIKLDSGKMEIEHQRGGFVYGIDVHADEDFGFEGPWFTWERWTFAHNNIKERLDRGVANSAWWTFFLNVVVCHLPHSFSGHYLILLRMDKGERHPRSFEFRFE